jgi:hypothetical protein
MESLVLHVLLTLAGSYFIVRNVAHLRDEKKLNAYIETSPKARLWVRKFGVEKTTFLTKRYFLPFGILVACGMLVVGLRGLLILM